MKLFDLRYMLYICFCSSRESLGERLETEDSSMIKLLGSVGNREMTFSTRKKRNNIDERNKKHKEDRKKVVRPFNFKTRYKSSSFARKRK